MSKLSGKVKESVKRRGVLGTAGFVLKAPFNFIIQRTPLQHRLREYKDWRFDRRYQVDTDGSIQLNELDINNPNRQHGQRYEAVPADVFHHMLAHLPEIGYQDFTFVDFGSGKGRALLLASEYSFKQIVGIEFSSQLDKIAKGNIDTYQSRTQKCKALTSICMDAVDFPLPSGNLLVFMANPFNEPIMAKVLGNIETSAEAHPCEIYIVYSNPQCGHLFDNAKFLTKLTHKGWFSIYKYTAPETVGHPA
ncbi:hypothetical protein BH20ACI3_BH20ACI3_05140 [soil metagenome]